MGVSERSTWKTALSKRTLEVIGLALGGRASSDGLGDLSVTSGALALGVAETAAGALDGAGEAGKLYHILVNRTTVEMNKVHTAQLGSWLKSWAATNATAQAKMEAVEKRMLMD